MCVGASCCICPAICYGITSCSAGNNTSPFPPSTATDTFASVTGWCSVVVKLPNVRIYSLLKRHAWRQCWIAWWTGGTYLTTGNSSIRHAGCIHMTVFTGCQIIPAIRTGACYRSSFPQTKLYSLATAVNRCVVCPVYMCVTLKRRYRRLLKWRPVYSFLTRAVNNCTIDTTHTRCLRRTCGTHQAPTDIGDCRCIAAARDRGTACKYYIPGGIGNFTCVGLSCSECGRCFPGKSIHTAAEKRNVVGVYILGAAVSSPRRGMPGVIAHRLVQRRCYSLNYTCTTDSKAYCINTSSTYIQSGYLAVR